jgi:hypothetical protein
LFTRPTWSNVLVLLADVLLAPGRRTITAALRILGRDQDPNFCTFHRVLNRAAWSSRAVARQLLLLLVNSFSFVASDAPVVIGIDDTIERRWDRRSAPAASIAIQSAPPRGTSSKPAAYADFLQCCWCSPWAGRIMAFPHAACPLQTLL